MIAVSLKTNRLENIGRTKFKSVIDGGRMLFGQTFEFECSVAFDDYGSFIRKNVTLVIQKVLFDNNFSNFVAIGNKDRISSQDTNESCRFCQ
jgi:hypothetical protein